MDTFVKRFQPERYQAWLEGKDFGLHPEDPPNAIGPAPLPTHLDVMCNKKYLKINLKPYMYLYVNYLLVFLCNFIPTVPL